ncbi:MAG: hypothetical protein AB7O37_17115 [Vicinamibacteria bacterium]
MSAADPEAAYYQAVEEFFVSRRGDPLFLSNPDWLLVKGWRDAGVPLRVVLRGIADALDSHAHSFARQRKIKSLAYCEGAVDEARERWLRALGGERSGDVASLLASSADALEAASGLGSHGRVRADSLAPELRARARQPADPRLLEEWLREREAELLRALREDLGEAGGAALEAEVDADLAAYRERLPEKVLARVRADALARRLLEANGLPRLSLFGL